MCFALVATSSCLLPLIAYILSQQLLTIKGSVVKVTATAPAVTFDQGPAASVMTTEALRTVAKVLVMGDDADDATAHRGKA